MNVQGDASGRSKLIVQTLISVSHFSTDDQKNLKTKNFIFSLKVAEMYRGRGTSFSQD